jgi:hypothetical protein
MRSLSAFAHIRDAALRLKQSGNAAIQSVKVTGLKLDFESLGVSFGLRQARRIR